MKTYHGQRTENGCEVTVDRRPLKVRSDLSGNATTPFDWGYVASGQLSVALLADFLGDDARAKALSHGFDQKVLASLPHDAWTRTSEEFATALEPLALAEAAVIHTASEHASADHLITNEASDKKGGGAVACGDMPFQTAGLLAEPLASDADD